MIYPPLFCPYRLQLIDYEKMYIIHRYMVSIMYNRFSLIYLYIFQQFVVAVVVLIIIFYEFNCNTVWEISTEVDS